MTPPIDTNQPTNRQWVDEALSKFSQQNDDKSITLTWSSRDSITELKATINQKINQELEELLEKVKEGIFIDPKLTAGENVQKFREEISLVIKAKIKDKS